MNLQDDVSAAQPVSMQAVPRDCPCCGARGGVVARASECVAEDLSPEELERAWAGGRPGPRAFFTFVTCAQCGLVYCPRYPSDAALGALYGTMSENMSDVPEAARVATQRGYFNTLRRFSDLRGRYLEIGPDCGFLVQMCAAEGALEEAVLFEPNAGVHSRLSSATPGVPQRLYGSLFDPSRVEPGSVHVAVMVHVLDHLRDPVAMLKGIRRLLAPNGVLLVVTHDVASPLTRLTGRRNPIFCVYHPQLFSPPTMAKTLEAAGMSVKTCERTVNHFPVGFLARHAGGLFGIDLSGAPEGPVVGLPLGNIVTVASADGRAV